MIPRRVVIIFPKDSIYKYKSEPVKYEIRKQVSNVIQFYKNLGTELSYNIIAEDELAACLLDEELHPNHLTALSKLDGLVLQKYSDIYKEYLDEITGVCDADLIKKAQEVVKPEQLEKPSQDELLRSKLRTMAGRCRYVTTEFLKTTRYIVVYFDKNNQYCSLPETKLGDLRVVHRVDMNLDIEEFWYSGQAIPKDLYEQVLREGM